MTDSMYAYNGFCLFVAIMSIIITISTSGIAFFLIKHFIHSSSTEIMRKGEIVQIKLYFKITASITLIFNSLNTFFNSLYCLYVYFDCPLHDDTPFIYHPSHIQRITSTVSWYIAKVSLIWFFSGRLYHGFKGSSLRVNRYIMIFINSFNTLFAPTSLCLAYWSVYNNYFILAEIAFNVWRIQYQIVVFYVLVQFSKRLLFLTMRELHSTNDNINRKGGKQRIYLLNVTTRNAILVTTISFTVFLVSICFFGFRFLFGEQTRLTLLIPLNMAAVDSLCTSICMICLFSTAAGDRIYHSICKFCDKNIYLLFVYMAKRQMTNKNAQFPMLTNSVSLSRVPEKLLRIGKNRSSLPPHGHTSKVRSSTPPPLRGQNMLSSVPSSSVHLGTDHDRSNSNVLSDVIVTKNENEAKPVELQVVFGDITSHSAPLSEPLSIPLINVSVLKIDSHSEPLTESNNKDSKNKKKYSKSNRNSLLLKKM